VTKAADGADYVWVERADGYWEKRSKTFVKALESTSDVAQIKKNIELIRNAIEHRVGRPYNLIDGETEGDRLMRATLASGGTPIASGPPRLDDKAGRFVPTADVNGRVRMDGTAAPAVATKATEDELNKALASGRRVG
jgi:hypothetical protein